MCTDPKNGVGNAAAIHAGQAAPAFPGSFRNRHRVIPRVNLHRCPSASLSPVGMFTFTFFFF